MSLGHGASIVRNGLVTHIDAANIKSYPGSANTWYDLSGYNNTVTLSNGPVYSTNNKGLINFDGVNDATNSTLTATQLGITTDFTISIFTRRTASPTNASQGQVGFGSGGSVSIKNSSYYFADVYSSTPTRYIVPLTSAAVGMVPYENVWVNLCVTVSTTTAKTYFNGALITTQVMDNNVKDFTTETISLSNGYGYYRLQGDIATMSVYNRALTITEIQQNFEATRGRYGI